MDKSITSFCKISNKFLQFTYYRVQLKMKRWTVGLLSMADAILLTYEALKIP